MLYESERKEHMDRMESNSQALSEIRNVLFEQD